MTDFKNGDLLGIKEDSNYYYYLVLSEPMYFGCRWAYAFHKKSENLLKREEVLSGDVEGFQALVDFQTRIDTKNIHKIGEDIDIAPFQVYMNSKVRIDKPEGGHEWYIFNSKLEILRKQQTLKTPQIKFPVASGITCKDANQLIDLKWRTEQIVEEEGRGQFPI